MNQFAVMGKHRRLLIVLVLVLVLGVLASLNPRGPAEPVYQGKPLSYWLRAYVPLQLGYASFGTQGNGVPSWGEVNKAVQHAGTNAIPILLDMLGAKETWLSIKVSELSRRLKYPRLAPMRSWEKQIAATAGLSALGETCRDAVPGIVRIYVNDDSAFTRASCLTILGNIGPAASNAVPLLLNEAAKASPGEEPTILQVLGRIHSDPDHTVPVLTNALQSSFVNARIEAVQALSKFGVKASNAVPALLQALHDSHPAVRTNASRALKAIDPLLIKDPFLLIDPVNGTRTLTDSPW